MNDRLMSVLLFVGVTLLSITPAHGQNLLNVGDAEDTELVKQWVRTSQWREPGTDAHAKFVSQFGSQVARNTEDAHFGTASLQATDRHFVFAPQMIEIDPTKTYQLSGFFKTTDGSKAVALFGCRLYDAKRRQIEHHGAVVIPNTLTKLSKPAKKGDQTIYIASTDWQQGKLKAIAFEVADDLSDLPNFNVKRITGMKVKGDECEVTIRRPVEQDYPAGTLVRQHGYMDSPSMQVDADGQWRKFEFLISSQGELGRPESDQFWHSTKFVRVCVMPNLDRRDGEPATFLFDDLAFELVDDAKAKSSQ